MTKLNRPDDNQEAKNISKETKKYNLPSLLKEGIYREFGNPIDPQKFDTHKKNKETNKGNIRVHMRDLRKENMEDWGDIDDASIDIEANDANIAEKLILLSKNLVFRRKRVYDRSLELFPSISNSDSALLRNEISKYNENELHNLITRNSVIRKMIYSVLPGLRGMAPSEQKDFDTIFGDKNNHFNEVEQIRLEKIFRNYYRFDQIPDGNDIDFILRGYSASSVSDNRRKEILAALGVTLTIKDAYEFGFIDDAFLRDFSETWFEETFNQLDNEAKSRFIRGLSKDDSYMIPASDFSISTLGGVFLDENKRRKLAQEVFRSVSLGMPEKEKVTDNTVVTRIRDKKKQEAELKQKDVEDYDVYDEFIKELGSLKKANGMPNHIENREVLKQKDAVLQFQHKNGSTQYIRITQVRGEDGNPLEIANGEEYGIEFESLNVSNGRLLTPQKAKVSYDQFENFLSEHDHLKALSSQDFDSLLTKDMNLVGEGSNKIYDARTIEDESVTALNIASKLDMLDSAGSQYGFEEGTAFIAPLQEEKSGKKHAEGGIWTVKKIHGDMVDLADPWGNISEKNLPLDMVYQVLKENESFFKRIAKIQDDTQMQIELKAFGIDGIKDGNMFIKEKDDHGHDVEKKVTCFQDKNKGGHIRMEFVKDGMVRFGEYDSTEDISNVKKYAEKNGLDEKVKGLYTWRSMSYAAFLKYLEKNGFTASTKDNIIVHEAGHDLHGDGHGHHHPHVHGSFMSRIFQMQNPASIWKGFEMMWHSIEHTLEKGAKLDAAKFAMGTAKFLNLPDSVSAQIYADVVDGSKEIVEKYEKKIFGLPGPRGREKCLHIIENHDSRPEEVAAAMNYMLKSYGHLYAEDIRHKQSIIQSEKHFKEAPKGTFMFFDAFVITAKLGDLHHWRAAAYKKAIGEMGSAEDHDGEPTEEQLIHALFKEIDGDWDKYPYAASVVKAIGGPGGFEKTWKFEGFENAKKKGNEQSQMVSAQGRLHKAIGYLGSHEIYKGIGSMEAVIGKEKSPKFQAFPFVWAVGGFSRYASHTALQNIKGYAEKGYSFHAYAFLKTPAENIIYRKVVRQALKEKGGNELVAKFDGLCKRLEFDANSPKHTKNAALDMMKLWQENCDGDEGLHSMLQGNNGWLIKKAKEGDPEIKAYLKTFSSKHMMQLNGTSVSGPEMQDQYNEWGLRMNRAMSYDEKTGLLSLNRTLNKIPLGKGGTKVGDRKMSDDDYDRLWGGIGDQMNTIRDVKFFKNDEALQKEQFLAYRKEIINFYITELNSRTPPKQTPDNIEQLLSLPHKYWKDIEKMGIDPHSIFDADKESETIEDDFKRWKSGTPYISGINRSGHALDITGLVQGRTAEVTGDIPPQKVTTMRKDNQGEFHSPDPDSYNAGGAIDEQTYDGD